MRVTEAKGRAVAVLLDTAIPDQWDRERCRAHAFRLVELGARTLGVRADGPVRRTDAGKPYFSQGSARFSISYDRGLVGVAVATCEVGVDVLAARTAPQRSAAFALSSLRRLSAGRGDRLGPVMQCGVPEREGAASARPAGHRNLSGAGGLWFLGGADPEAMDAAAERVRVAWTVTEAVVKLRGASLWREWVTHQRGGTTGVLAVAPAMAHTWLVPACTGDAVVSLVADERVEPGATTHFRRFAP